MLIIFNPAAGRGRTQVLRRVLDILQGNGVRIELVETQYPGDAEIIARAAARSGTPLVVAAGGDGTIAEIAHGLIGSSAKLGIIPIGTANVLAHEFVLPFAPDRIAAALALGRTHILHPGMMTSGDRARLFVQMLGVGFDGHVVHSLSLSMKRRFGRTAYALNILQSLRTYRFLPITLWIDGAETQTRSVVISKGRLYGGTFGLAHDACPGRPGFSVTLFDNMRPLAALLYSASLPLGLLGHMPGIRRMRAHDIVFGGGSHVPVQADGDPAGVTPLHVRDVPMPLSIIVEP